MRLLFYALCVVCRTAGMPSCPCTSSHTPQTDQYRNDQGLLVYIDPTTSEEYRMPADYGLSECKAHDIGYSVCTDPIDQPAWCTDEWCYIDVNNCVGDSTWEVETDGPVSGLLSGYFPLSLLRYSYGTCGTASYFAKYHAASIMSATELFAVPEKYVREIVQRFEDATDRIVGGREGQGELNCEFLDSCFCDTCTHIEGSQWSVMAVDLRKSSIAFNAQERGRYESEAKCIGRQVQASFRSIAQQTYNDPNRVAYMYFGIQENGAIIQWPASQWCPTHYDARFRPWYASAASGPKDVVLTLDNSGSMMQNNRWTLLKEGVELILKTLTEYDYLGVVLFSNDGRTFHPELRPATLALKSELLAWLRDPTQDPMGGTDFEAAMETTFKLIKRSRSQGATTKCQTAVLFMTDGVDRSGFDVASMEILQDGLEPRAILFTYTFGSGAEANLPQKMACANEGVYWGVDDGSSIGLVMSDYYKYFANGVKNTVPRWVTYADYLTNETLMAACLPAYRNDVLMGAGCMDVNMMIRLSTLEQKPEYPEFIRQVRQSSSRCAAFELPKEKLDEIRIGAGTNCTPGWHWKTQLVVFGGGAGVGVFVIIGLIFCCRKCCRKCCRRQPRTNQVPVAAGVAANQLPGINQVQVNRMSQQNAPNYGNYNGIAQQVPPQAGYQGYYDNQGGGQQQFQQQYYQDIPVAQPVYN